jgi:hypothetical protein
MTTTTTENTLEEKQTGQEDAAVVLALNLLDTTGDHFMLIRVRTDHVPDDPSAVEVSVFADGMDVPGAKEAWKGILTELVEDQMQ